MSSRAKRTLQETKRTWNATSRAKQKVAVDGETGETLAVAQALTVDTVVVGADGSPPRQVQLVDHASPTRAKRKLNESWRGRAASSRSNRDAANAVNLEAEGSSSRVLFRDTVMGDAPPLVCGGLASLAEMWSASAPADMPVVAVGGARAGTGVTDGGAGGDGGVFAQAPADMDVVLGVGCLAEASRTVVYDFASAEAVAQDAEGFMKQYDGDTLMETCAICAYEDGKARMKPLPGLTKPREIEALALLKVYFDTKVSLRVEEVMDVFQVTEEDGRRRVQDQFHGLTSEGLVDGCTFVCDGCCKALNSRDDDRCKWRSNRGIGIPKRAVVNGLWPGRVPKELVGLSRVEVSLISLYNPLTTISLLPTALTDFKTIPSVYTVVNDVTGMAMNLPRTNVEDLYVTFKSAHAKSDSDLEFRPQRVKDALVWLVEHNVHYARARRGDQLFIDEDVLKDWIDQAAERGGESLAVPATTLDEDETKLLDQAHRIKEAGHSTLGGTG